MALSASTAAKRIKELPSEFEASLAPAESQGRRQLLEWSADKFNTARVRVYVPASMPAGTLNGFVLDYGAEDTTAEEPDHNDKRGQVVARSVVAIVNGKPKFAPMDADNYEETILIVTTIPDWAEVEKITLSV